MGQSGKELHSYLLVPVAIIETKLTIYKTRNLKLLFACATKGSIGSAGSPSSASFQNMSVHADVKCGTDNCYRTFKQPVTTVEPHVGRSMDSSGRGLPGGHAGVR